LSLGPALSVQGALTGGAFAGGLDAFRYVNTGAIIYF
jgi:hypothetical protein